MKVILVGTPNCGKTTLFNWLTGLSAKAVNYPGSTVEIGRGPAAAHWNLGCEFVDTPGVLGVMSQKTTADEEVTREVLRGASQVGDLDLVFCVMDGTQLPRQLVLFEQLRDLGHQPIVVLTMADMVPKAEQERLQEILELVSERPVFWVDGRLGGGLQPLIDFLKTTPRENRSEAMERRWDEGDYRLAHSRIRGWLASAAPSPKDLARCEEKRNQGGEALACQREQSALRAWTETIDAWVLNPWAAFPLLFVAMSVLFSLVFVAAQPLMDGIDSGVSLLGTWVQGASGGAMWGLFLSDGVLAGFGSFLVFVPQIALLFLALAFLEGSGYLARTVVLVDRPFSKLGLTGRSLVPLLVGFACAVPAMMATRTISSRRDRLITNFILPIMSCSARLPVFTLLISFLMNEAPVWQKGMAMAGLYLFSLVMGGVAALILDRMLPRTEISPLAIELPLYRWPSWRLVFRQTLSRVRSFVERAAPIIFVLTLSIWFLSRFPVVEGATPQEQVNQSYLGQAGKFLEPAFTPMGADWRVGVGLLSAFAAREVFVSTLALIMSGSSDNEGDTLLESLRQAQWPNGQPLFTMASVAALIVFFVIALQCLSTVAISARENGSWRFALLQLFVLNGVAYGLAVLTFRLLT